jgi:hypothetical protein
MGAYADLFIPLTPAKAGVSGMNEAVKLNHRKF